MVEKLLTYRNEKKGIFEGINNYWNHYDQITEVPKELN